jgi:rhodanese-related sulfurtransferase
MVPGFAGLPERKCIYMVEITVEELKQWREEHSNLCIVDVRQPDEFNIVSLTNSINIPLEQLPSNFMQLPAGEKIVTLCHHGIRSLRAATWLRSQGYEAFSVHGGIDAWTIKIDPSLPTY